MRFFLFAVLWLMVLGGVAYFLYKIISRGLLENTEARRERLDREASRRQIRRNAALARSEAQRERAAILARIQHEDTNWARTSVRATTPEEPPQAAAPPAEAPRATTFSSVQINGRQVLDPAEVERVRHQIEEAMVSAMADLDRSMADLDRSMPNRDAMMQPAFTQAWSRGAAVPAVPVSQPAATQRSAQVSQAKPSPAPAPDKNIWDHLLED